MNNSNNHRKGLGLCGVLTIVFIVLKLVGVINWSWIWVLSPLWINLILCGIVFLFLVFILNKKAKTKFKRSDRLKW